MINKQNGFGLVSVIMSASIMGIISLGITNMIMTNAKTMSYLEDKSAVLDLKGLVTLHLSNENSCLNSLKAINFSTNAMNIQNLRDRTNRVIYTSLGSYGRINFGNMRIGNNNLPVSVSSTGLVKLIIPVTRQRGDQAIAAIEIPIQVSTSTTAPIKVSNCVAVGNGESLNNMSRGCTHPITNQLAEEGDIYSTRVRTGREGLTTTTSVCINKKWVGIESTFEAQER